LKDFDPDKLKEKWHERKLADLKRWYGREFPEGKKFVNHKQLEGIGKL
jgi:hypothetical protein